MLISTYYKRLKDNMQHHPVVPQEEWLAARKALLLKKRNLPICVTRSNVAE